MPHCVYTPRNSPRSLIHMWFVLFFFQAEDGIRDLTVTGVQTCALPIFPISGWLVGLFGRKRFFITCIVIFTISSFLCGIAPSLGTLLIFRVLQGAGGGGDRKSVV